ncbi:MAG: hypothetical protein ABIQ31_08240 [Ferruginibacter sp.]
MLAGDYKKQVTIPPRQVHLLLSVTCICWLAAKLTGWKLWIAERSFPVVPPFGFLYNLPTITHWILLIVSVTSLLLLIIKPGNKIIQGSLLCSELFSCLLDENRWQPWEYLYLFILFIFIINKNKTAAITNCFIILLATIYFYSGLHKFNDSFLSGIWENMVLKRFLKIPVPVDKGWLHYAGYILPVIESFSGIGLLFLRTRKIAAIMLISMHLFILLLVGPFGLHYEKIVWPWNMAMIFFHRILYIKNSQVSLQSSFLNNRNKIILFCWGILPAFNFVGLWDNFLSWNLYSSELPQMAICIKDPATAMKFQSLINKKDNLNICNGSALINVQAWALHEMGVPACPEERTFRKIKERWKKDFPLSNVDFIIYYFPFKPIVK